MEGLELAIGADARTKGAWRVHWFAQKLDTENTCRSFFAVAKGQTCGRRCIYLLIRSHYFTGRVGVEVLNENSPRNRTLPQQLASRS